MSNQNYNQIEIYEQIKEAIEATDKDWIAWAESKCPHDKDLIKRRCAYCWAERKKEINP